MGETSLRQLTRSARHWLLWNCMCSHRSRGATTLSPSGVFRRCMSLRTKQVPHLLLLSLRSSFHSRRATACGEDEVGSEGPLIRAARREGKGGGGQCRAAAVTQAPPSLNLPTVSHRMCEPLRPTVCHSGCPRSPASVSPSRRLPPTTYHPHLPAREELTVQTNPMGRPRYLLGGQYLGGTLSVPKQTLLSLSYDANACDGRQKMALGTLGYLSATCPPHGSRSSRRSRGGEEQRGRGEPRRHSAL